MAQSYREITPALSQQIKLVMTDVDGTLTPGGDVLSPGVPTAVKKLQESGLVIGLVSGRHLSNLEAMSGELGINGPIIAENGGVARIRAGADLVNLGYSQQPAIEDLQKLKGLFPGAIKEREDNKDRLVDLVFRSRGVPVEDLRKHLDNTDLLDSGYILHLMQKGISKGKTLMRLIQETGNFNLSAEEVLVLGDSQTDLSLFQLFPHSVLITNPRLPIEQRQALQRVARYTSDLFFGEGFAEVACHIANLRLAADLKNQAE